MNRPQQISTSFKEKKSIGGNATENRTLLRLIPLLIGNDVLDTEPKWELLLNLRQLVELCFAPIIQRTEVEYLRMQIASHLVLFKECFPAASFKPKHHFLQHYPHMIELYGPLLQCCTIRYEGKHKYFKSVVKHAQCFKNICKTLSTQHQLAQAFHMSRPKLCNEEIVFHSCFLLNLNTLNDDIVDVLNSKFSDTGDLKETKKIIINALEFHQGLFVTCHVDILPKFGKICHILVEMGAVYFLVECQNTIFNEHYGMYEVESEKKYSIVKSTDLVDAFPLQGYQLPCRNICLPLRHWISLENVSFIFYIIV